MLKSHIVVMGVAGSGKSTVGSLLAKSLSWPFAEGDDFHSVSNLEKMSKGIPLSDEDRSGWLISIRDWMNQQAELDLRVVMTCSALRKSYRDILRVSSVPIIFLHLHGSEQDIQIRMEARSDHFMPLSLLPSQFAALETLETNEIGLTVSVLPSPEEIVSQCIPLLADLDITAHSPTVD